MRPPIFVRALTERERERLEIGLRSTDGYELRRCRILLASARGGWVPPIAAMVDCNDQSVRNVLQEFARDGQAAYLTRGSSRPHTIHAKVDAAAAEQIRALLHRSPRTFGKPTSVWTMDLAAKVSFAQGITAERVTGERMRQAILRLGVRWLRGKQWITSPDAAYARKNARDRLIRLAASHPTGVLGFQDEVWWSRLARPSSQTWVKADDRFCGWSSRRSHRTPRTPRLSRAIACCCAGTGRPARRRPAVAALRRRPARQPGHHRLPGLVLWEAPRRRQGGAAPDLIFHSPPRLA